MKKIGERTSNTIEWEINLLGYEIKVMKENLEKSQNYREQIHLINEIDIKTKEWENWKKRYYEKQEFYKKREGK